MDPTPFTILSGAMFLDALETRIQDICRRHGKTLEKLVISNDGSRQLLTEEQLARIDAIVVCDEFFNSENPRYKGRGPLSKLFGTALRAPNLKWFHVEWIGTDSDFFTTLRDRGVLVTNSPNVNSEPIAHTILAAVMMFSRGFPTWMANQREKKWVSLGDCGGLERRPLKGQRAVIVGMGSIGRHTGTLLKVLGMHVIGVRRRPMGVEDAGSADEMVPPSRLLEVAHQADWIISTLPKTDATIGLISREIIASLPPRCHFISVGRGEVVDEGALSEALQAGKLAGAYLDVFHTEPLPVESPLWTTPNVIISPHNSALSSGNHERGKGIFLNRLRDYLSSSSKRKAAACL